MFERLLARCDDAMAAHLEAVLSGVVRRHVLASVVDQHVQFVVLGFELVREALDLPV